ncbi:MAG: M48 family metalloprotease [Alphaproteobacteria bacterium]
MALGLSLTILIPFQANAQGKISIIRDAEIENTLRVYATPIFISAGLVPEDVRLHIVSDPRLNAFVAGGQRMFLHTGLLMRADNPSQVIGVMAHETGHIAGGHLARAYEALRNANAQAIVSSLLAIGVGVAAGRPDAAMAGVQVGQGMAIASLMSYSRGQEASADQAGVSFLEQNGLSARGLMEFFDILRTEEQKYGGNGSLYLRSHPLTEERISFVAAHLKTSRYTDAKLAPDLIDRHERMRAKLAGFLYPPKRVLESYYPDEKTLYARYARAIAYYRLANLTAALPLIDGLIAELPNDPYFHELRGQMLFDNGRIAESLPSYQKAVQLAPDEPLLQSEIARVQIELNNQALLPEAIEHLKESVARDDEEPGPWRLLAIAYGRLGDMGNSSLGLAESALRRGNAREAQLQAKRAQGVLAYGSPGWLRAQDIERAASDEIRKTRDRR